MRAQDEDPDLWAEQRAEEYAEWLEQPYWDSLFASEPIEETGNR